MTNEASPSAFEYDVAISFASDDKTVAEKLASQLVAKNITVFHDEHTESDRWGKDVIDHLVNLYARKARYCLLLISQHYPLKAWTEAERTSAQERAFRDANEYILLLRLDDSEVPGLTEASGYMDLRRPHEDSLEGVVSWFEEKLSKAKDKTGIAPKSHDLRSGNVPKTT